MYLDTYMTSEGTCPVYVQPPPLSQLPSASAILEEEKEYEGKRKVVSQDEVAIQLSLQEDINIVFSSSSFACLMDNFPPYEEEWFIPITIVKREKAEGNAGNLSSP